MENYCGRNTAAKDAENIGIKIHRSAEGVKGGRAWGECIPLHSRLEGLGERRKLSHWGPGQSPRRK